MLLCRIIFWTSCFLVFYNYAGYAVLVYGFNRVKRLLRPAPEYDESYLPSISFVVAAYNEEDCIKQKITNSLHQNYPAARIEFIFITDGSTDRTPDIVGEYAASVKLMHGPERKGKSAALNRAIAECTGHIVVVSDANTLLNADALKHIARHYKNPQTGGVAGEKKVMSVSSGQDEVGSGEGLYWKYESFLKRLDSEFYSVVGAAGELFSIRRDLFEFLPDNVVLDDFVLSMRVAQKGYRIRYEPDAYATELPSFSIRDEQKRKIRIAAGGFQSILLLSPLLAFWRYPRLSFLYISHRVLRWTLSPLCMILAFITNGILCFIPGVPLLYLVAMAVQLAFYGSAFLAFISPSFRNTVKIGKLSYYFTFMNISVILGFFRFLRGRQVATWEKARRAQGSLNPE